MDRLFGWCELFVFLCCLCVVPIRFISPTFLIKNGKFRALNTHTHTPSARQTKFSEQWTSVSICQWLLSFSLGLFPIFFCFSFAPSRSCSHQLLFILFFSHIHTEFYSRSVSFQLPCAWARTRVRSHPFAFTVLCTSCIFIWQSSVHAFHSSFDCGLLKLSVLSFFSGSGRWTLLFLYIYILLFRTQKIAVVGFFLFFVLALKSFFPSLIHWLFISIYLFCLFIVAVFLP